MGPYKTSAAIDERVERAMRELSRWKLEDTRHRKAAQRGLETNILNPVAAADCQDLAEILTIEIDVLKEIGPPSSATKTLEVVELIGRLERLASKVNRTLAVLQRAAPKI